MENILFAVPGKNRVRASRFDLDGQIRVESRTIGSDLSYELTSLNISKTGMLLTWKSSVKIPFMEKTILELTVDPDGNILKKPLRCLAKIVRKFNQDGCETYGVRIVQMETEDVGLWESTIRSFAHLAGDFSAA